MLKAYANYLDFLDSRLDKFFKTQKPYIFCKKGCAKCCKHAQFPYSLLEMKYLLSGLEDLKQETLYQIEENLQNILKCKAKFKGKKFLYNISINENFIFFCRFNAVYTTIGVLFAVHSA